MRPIMNNTFHWQFLCSDLHVIRCKFNCLQLFTHTPFNSVSLWLLNLRFSIPLLLFSFDVLILAFFAQFKWTKSHIMRRRKKGSGCRHSSESLDTVLFEILLQLLFLPHLRSIAPANYPMEQIFGDKKPTPPSEPISTRTMDCLRLNEWVCWAAAVQQGGDAARALADESLLRLLLTFSTVINVAVSSSRCPLVTQSHFPNPTTLTFPRF